MRTRHVRARHTTTTSNIAHSTVTVTDVVQIWKIVWKSGCYRYKWIILTPVFSFLFVCFLYHICIYMYRLIDTGDWMRVFSFFCTPQISTDKDCFDSLFFVITSSSYWLCVAPPIPMPLCSQQNKFTVCITHFLTVYIIRNCTHQLNSILFLYIYIFTFTLNFLNASISCVISLHYMQSYHKRRSVGIWYSTYDNNILIKNIISLF